MSSIRQLSGCHIVLWIAAILGISPHSLAAVGRTEGMPSVSNTGAANYTIPVQLPPGTNNLAPNLSLVYDHRNGDSLLGMGFALSGLSTIAVTSSGPGPFGPGFRQRFGVKSQRYFRFTKDS